MQYYPHLLTSCKASRLSSNDDLPLPIHIFKEGDLCCALYFGPKQTNDPRWVPAVVVKRSGTRSIQVRIVHQGSLWQRHIDQLRPRYPSTEDDKPGEDYTFDTDNTPNSEQNNNAPESSTQDELESSIQVSTNTLPHSPVLPFMALLIHDNRRGPKSKELYMVGLWLIIKTPFEFVLLVSGGVVSFCIAH